MTSGPRRKRGGYFPTENDGPPPLIVRLGHRVRFSDVDPMTVLWHGRYANLFEQANEELGRSCGLGYADFKREQFVAPIVQLHVDYFAPVTLGEQVTIIGKMMWHESARLNLEYDIHKENGDLAAAGYTVQMFVDHSGEPLMTCPSILELCRKRWLAGEFGGLR